MVFSDFTFPKLYKKYGISQEEIALFVDSQIPFCEPSTRLQQDIEDAKLIQLYSEKAKSEAITFPIIREIRIKKPHIAVFSGFSLSIESDKELNGAPDFMLIRKQKVSNRKKPFFALLNLFSVR